MRYHPVDAPTNAFLREPLCSMRRAEHLSERCIRHVWECDACGYQFETAVYLGADEASEQRCQAA
jgi:hypothetical protein